MGGPAAVRIVALAVALLIPLVAFAQDVTEPALKAAFIYNFVRFTEWPRPLAASEPFVICVLGDAAVGDALERVVRTREIAGRRITVSLVTLSAPKDACRVLYVSHVPARDVASVLTGLQDSPVLTISDGVGFTDAGGHAQFFFERGRLRFNIDLEAVKRSRLRISSNLLLLAKRYES